MSSEYVAESSARESAPKRLTTVVAADICGYSRLAERDESAALRTIEIIKQIFESVIQARRGRIFHSAGDGFLAEFPSASDGVLAALELIEDLKKRDRVSVDHSGAEVRVGVHAGDVVEKPDGDLLGHGVNIAARLQGEATPGGVLVSLHTVNLVRGKIDARFHRRGPLTLKNIDEPVVAFDAFSESARGRPFLEIVRNFFVRVPAISIAAIIAVAGLFLYQLSGNDALFYSAPPTENIETEAAALTAKVANSNPAGTQKKDDPSYDSALRRSVVQLMRMDERYSNKAIRALSDGDLGQAVVELKKVREMLTKSVATKKDQLIAVQLAIATLLYHIDPKASLTEFQMAHDQYDQRDPTVLNLLGQLYLTALNDPSQARAMFIALKSQPNLSPAMQFAAEHGIGTSFWYLEDYELSERHLSRALKIARMHELEIEESTALASLGSLNILRENYVDAEKYRRSALAMERARRDYFAAGKSLNMMGVISSRLGNHDEATAHYSQALKIREDLKDLKGIASVNSNLGDTYRSQGLYEEAQTYYWRSLDIAIDQGIPNLIGLGYQGLALASSELNDTRCACVFAAAAVEAYKQSSNDINDTTRGLINSIPCSELQSIAGQTPQCRPAGSNANALD